MITSNYSISVNLYWRKTYIFVIKIKTLSYITVPSSHTIAGVPLIPSIWSILN
ncbi:hypothetical protein [Arsenophonus endosymbiont of Bemisia tabaci]|uniref:hypothetical protein n=1 Tax=Arsenophonus endosymbiont of Bemisia tabaci TaxID=536059 RepID=UPI0015F7027E|nr:hypothetical protein [Arsenophonus endosymbiont of Bemisia tabaci]